MKRMYSGRKLFDQPTPHLVRVEFEIYHSANGFYDINFIGYTAFIRRLFKSGILDTWGYSVPHIETSLRHTHAKTIGAAYLFFTNASDLTVLKLSSTAHITTATMVPFKVSFNVFEFTNS